MDTLKVKKAWEVALGPIKGLPMTGIMMYMSGNSLQIFSIMMVFMAFKNPIMGLLGTNQAFERFETETNKQKILQVKLAYIVMQLVALALGVWKVNNMGLLPLVKRPLFQVTDLVTDSRVLERRDRTGLLGRYSENLWSMQSPGYRPQENPRYLRPTSFLTNNLLLIPTTFSLIFRHARGASRTIASRSPQCVGYANINLQFCSIERRMTANVLTIPSF